MFEQKILKFSDIYLYQIGKFMYLFKTYLLPNFFVMCLLLQARYIRIIQEISALFYTRHCRTNFLIPVSRCEVFQLANS